MINVLGGGGGPLLISGAHFTIKASYQGTQFADRIGGYALAPGSLVFAYILCPIRSKSAKEVWFGLVVKRVEGRDEGIYIDQSYTTCFVPRTIRGISDVGF